MFRDKIVLDCAVQDYAVLDCAVQDNVVLLYVFIVLVVMNSFNFSMIFNAFIIHPYKQISFVACR